MPRRPSTRAERARGARLGKRLQKARQDAGRTTEEVARTSGISVDTLRRIEQGRIANPGLFTVASAAAVIDLGLDDLVPPLELENP